MINFTVQNILDNNMFVPTPKILFTDWASTRYQNGNYYQRRTNSKM